MYHTSPREITKINDYGIAGDCLFFSDEIYCTSASPIIYIYEANFECIAVSQLYDEEIVKEIAERFKCSLDIANGLLDASEDEADHIDCDTEDYGELSWWLQGKQGECAKKMGYDGCRSIDEQGTVYIIPMKGREDDLKLIEISK